MTYIVKIIELFGFLNRQQNSEFNSNTQLVEINSNKIQKASKSNSIYIGKYNSQIYAQNIKYEDEEDELFKKRFLFENNKEMLQKTKSTMNNNLVIPNKYSKNQQQNQIALITYLRKEVSYLALDLDVRLNFGDSVEPTHISI